MAAWLKRFGLHLAAAVGATGVFVAAAAVGANQSLQQADLTSPTPVATVVDQPTDQPTAAATPRPRPTTAPRPERSVAGTIQAVDAGRVQVRGVGGRTWNVQPAAGALIRLNGKTVKLDALQPGDSVVVLGQGQPGARQRFQAHAITARRG